MKIFAVVRFTSMQLLLKYRSGDILCIGNILVVKINNRKNLFIARSIIGREELQNR